VSSPSYPIELNRKMGSHIPFFMNLDLCVTTRGKRKFLNSRTDPIPALPATLRYLSAGGDSPRVGIKDDLQEDRRIIGRSPHLVVLIPGIKKGQIYFLVDEVMKAILKGSRQDLSVKVYRYELPLGIIIVLISRHPVLLSGPRSLLRY